MNKLSQLREHRNQKAQEAQALNGKYAADQRMPAPEAEKLDTVLAEIEAIDVDISRENRLAQLALESKQEESLLNAATKDPAKQSDESKALRSFFAGGIMNMAEADRARMLARQTPDIRNAMSTTTTTEGGFTVATEYQKSLEEAMKAFGGMREVASKIRTATGASMNFPTSDSTAEIGEIVGQNITVARADTVFGNTSLDVYKYSSKDIALPFELIQDSFIDIETFIQGLLAVRLGRITNTHYTVGTGTAQPRGIVTAAAAGKVGATGQTLSVTYDDLVDLEHSVDPSYRKSPGVGFMMHDASVKALRKLKDTQGRPIFIPDCSGHDCSLLSGRDVNAEIE